MPEVKPGLTRTEYWIIGIFGAFTLFISVLLHELAHSFVALKYGLKVHQIMLFIFGGVSYIEEQEEVSKDFRKEFKIAVVGPITSFIIAGVLALAWWILAVATTQMGFVSTTTTTTTTATTIYSIKTIIEVILQYGAIINTVLGGFNLIPAFPLDGGRILRSALLRENKDYYRSTKLAVKIGIAISYGFMAFGFIIMFSGSFISGIWILFIGWFLNSGAQSYLSQYELSSVLSKVRLRDIMNTRFVSVKPDMTVNDLLVNYFNVYRKSEFPVVEEKYDALLGTVTAKQAMDVPEYKRITVTVNEIMMPKNELIVMKSNRTAEEALRRIFRENKSRIFVYESYEEDSSATIEEEKGAGRQRLVGLVSKTDILNTAKEREKFEKDVSKLGDSSNSAMDNNVERGIRRNTHYGFNIISRQRLLFLVYGIVLFIGIYSVGAMLVEINSNEAQIIKKQFEEQIKGINQFGIFLNNIKVALGMFIPGFGIALGIFSAFSTGVVFNAVSQTSPSFVSHHISPLIVFLTPFGILEAIAYGIAISRSGILSYQLIKTRKKSKYWKEKYLIPTIIEIGVVIAILFVGAIIEWQMAQQLGRVG
jgi:Zn-dependent protease/predicted transcriptional regulator